MVDWPPALAILKEDASIPDDRDDTRLQLVLSAAVVVVQRLREGEVNFAGDPDSDLPAPDEDLVLGTVRMAWRWHVRRRSPDALVSLTDLGATRVPTFDPDVEMLLQIGRHRGPVIAG